STTISWIASFGRPSCPCATERRAQEAGEERLYGAPDAIPVPIGMGSRANVVIGEPCGEPSTLASRGTSRFATFLASSEAVRRPGHRSTAAAPAACHTVPQGESTRFGVSTRINQQDAGVSAPLVL